MRIFTKFHFRLSKSDKTGDVFRKIVQALKEADVEFEPGIYVTDPGNGTVSSVDRIIKKFPTMKEYEYMKSDWGTDTPPNKALSNLNGGWDVPHHNQTEISIEVLEGIADGIPRAYPSNKTTFVWSGAKWDDNDKHAIHANHEKANPGYPMSYYSSSVILQSDWWVSGRTLNLWAMVELPAPSEVDVKLERISEKAQKFISLLGKIQKEELVIVPSFEEEQDILKKREQALEITKWYDTARKKWDAPHPYPPFPHTLPNPSLLHDTDESVSPKAVINQIFKSKGYKYLSNFSGRGIYTLVKRLPNNNRLVLEFDFTPIGRDLSCALTYQGLFWNNRVQVRITDNTDYCPNNYHITNTDILEKVVLNMAAAVDFLEKEYVPKITEIYGSSPVWMEY
ncbi:hypothetical protein [Brevibacillus daliensis]|uniref:hypothetical protein n=1 Tax=Brevibacillus daliensis TaxID=2892995 RepID=UPI001E6034EB|nr:hypothetical protein [Brevibacillus daliensis]